MQGNEFVALDPSQKSEKKRSGTASDSSSLDADDDSDPMDFDNEVLDALAHLDSAPAAPTNIKTFKSVTPSARSPQPAGEPSGFASDSDGVHTDAYDGDSDEVVSDEDGNPAYATRSAGHGEKQSMFTSRSNLSHLAPKVRKSRQLLH